MSRTREHAVEMWGGLHPDEFVAAISVLRAGAGQGGETAGLYLLICTLWGLVTFAALAFALS